MIRDIQDKHIHQSEAKRFEHADVPELYRKRLSFSALRLRDAALWLEVEGAEGLRLLLSQVQRQLKAGEMPLFYGWASEHLDATMVRAAGLPVGALKASLSGLDTNGQKP